MNAPMTHTAGASTTITASVTLVLDGFPSFATYTLSGASGEPALLLGIILEYQTAFGADTPDYLKRVEALVTNWQAQFGPIDFSTKQRLNWMLSVQPQPLSSFKAFDGEVLSPSITRHHQMWIRLIFKGTFLNALTNLGPSKYYLNEGRTESSLLYYELEFDGNRVSIQASYEAFLMTFRPRHFDATKGIDRETIGQVLFEWVNLNKRRPPIPQTIRIPGSTNLISGDTDEGDPFTIPYTSLGELLDSFKLPPQLKVGDTFSNWTNAPPDITHYLNYWPAYVVGFVGSNGISVILFKTYYGGPRIGRLYDRNWLKKGLFQADGKTLIDPPKHRERNEAPYFLGLPGAIDIRRQ